MNFYKVRHRKTGEWYISATDQLIDDIRNNCVWLNKADKLREWSVIDGEEIHQPSVFDYIHYNS